MQHRLDEGVAVSSYEAERRNKVLAVSMAILRDIPTRNVESLQASLEVLISDLASYEKDLDRTAYPMPVSPEGDCLENQLQGMMRAFCDLHMPVSMDDAEVTVYDWPILLEACTASLAERSLSWSEFTSIVWELSEISDDLGKTFTPPGSDVAHRLRLLTERALALSTTRYEREHGGVR